jgi:hypothetical protein
VIDQGGGTLRLRVGFGDLRDGRSAVFRREIVVSHVSRRDFRCADEAPSEVGKVEKTMTLYMAKHIYSRIPVFWRCVFVLQYRTPPKRRAHVST